VEGVDDAFLAFFLRLLEVAGRCWTGSGDLEGDGMGEGGAEREGDREGGDEEDDEENERLL